MKFAIFGNTGKAGFLKEKKEIFKALESHGDTLCIHTPYLKMLQKEGVTLHSPNSLDVRSGYEWEQLCRLSGEPFDAVISIGGDGTFLRTASMVWQTEVPVLGINAGRLGFLADITADKVALALDHIHTGEFTIEERALLKLEFPGADKEDGKEADSPDFLPKDFIPYALNDIAVLKHDISSMISIHTTVDSTPLTTYMADGLVIATPTGSTAYSLSVGGPVITPGAGVICLTPVAPHSLTTRPLILRNHQQISLSVESRSGNFLVSVDGRSFSCPQKVPMQICLAPFSLKVIRPLSGDFFTTLREKMMWGTDSRS